MAMLKPVSIAAMLRPMAKSCENSKAAMPAIALHLFMRKERKSLLRDACTQILTSLVAKHKPAASSASLLAIRVVFGSNRYRTIHYYQQRLTRLQPLRQRTDMNAGFLSKQHHHKAKGAIREPTKNWGTKARHTTFFQKNATCLHFTEQL